MKGEIGVILVDADQEYRMLIKDKLEAYGGFRILASVSDGAAALREVREKKPQFVVMEIVLPGLDGLGLLRQITQEEHPPKVIILSQWMNKDIIAAALSRGATYYLTKPCNLESLAEHMTEAAHRVRMLSPAWGDFVAERVTVETLRKLGVAPNCTGMRLARDMILLAVKEPERLYSVAQQIYQPFLRDENDNIKRIEHALRYVIETAWRGGDAAEYQFELFGNTVRSKCGRPSNSTFLAVVSEHVRMELQRQKLCTRRYEYEDCL